MKITERFKLAIQAWAGDNRQSEIYPRLFNIFNKKRPLPRTSTIRLRTLSRTVYARRAINAIKDPISQMQWDIRLKKGVKMTPELQKQIDAATAVFTTPNTDDDFISFIAPSPRRLPVSKCRNIRATPVRRPKAPDEPLSN